jgi:hypothetical protein
MQLASPNRASRLALKASSSMAAFDDSSTSYADVAAAPEPAAVPAMPHEISFPAYSVPPVIPAADEASSEVVVVAFAEGATAAAVPPPPPPPPGRNVIMSRSPTLAVWAAAWDRFVSIVGVLVMYALKLLCRQESFLPVFIFLRHGGRRGRERERDGGSEECEVVAHVL